MNERIKLRDTVLDAIIKMSEGNPGATRVCAEIVRDGGAIDPLAFGGGLLKLLSLDSLGIYGSRIWMLYKDVCGCDLTATLGMLRAHQLGFIKEEQLNHAIDNWVDGLDVNELVSQVKERLGTFGVDEDTSD